ncbi:MAG: hypothetical protein ACUZ8H_09665, partial [Candidatus Anammoxibacter sp.]
MKKSDLKKSTNGILILVFAISVLSFGCEMTPIGNGKKEVEDVPIPPDNFIGMEKVIRHPSDDRFPEVSPDGTMVAYAAKKGDNFDVFYFDPFQ